MINNARFVVLVNVVFSFLLRFEVRELRKDMFIRDFEGAGLGAGLSLVCSFEFSFF